MSEKTEEGARALEAMMEVRIESDAVGSAAREKTITDALNAIDGVHDVKVAKGAIFVTYDALKTTEKKIEESTRASGGEVKSATTGATAPSVGTETLLADSHMHTGEQGDSIPANENA